MPTRYKFFFIVLALCCFQVAGSAETAANLKPEGYVSDFAHVLSSNASAQLTVLCAEVDQKAHAQIAVVTIHSLGGEPIDTFANDLFTKWGVGYKGTDRGVMVIIAVNDRRYRIEVGYGLEPILTDALVGRFGREAVPAFRSGNYGAGLGQLTLDVASAIAKASGVKLTSPVDAIPTYRQDGSSRVSPIVPLIIVLVLLGFFGSLSSGFGGRRRGWRRGWGWPWFWGGFGGFGGGRFGGGGFGGGGFGGGGFGGGMSGGGGASGGW